MLAEGKDHRNDDSCKRYNMSRGRRDNSLKIEYAGLSNIKEPYDIIHVKFECISKG